MSTNTVNQNHFSKMCGVSRQAVGKAVKTNLIKMIGKKINLDHRVTCEYYYSKTGNRLRPEYADNPEPPQPRQKPLKTKPPVKKKKVTNTDVEEITAPIAEDDDDLGFDLPEGFSGLDSINEKNIHLLPHDYIKKLKDVETAMSTKTKREELLGTLIKRSTVRQVFGKLYTIDTTQWKSLEDRLAPDICGIFDFEEGCPEEVEVRKKITEEVVKTLRFVKRLMDDFLVKNKEDAL